MRAGAPGAAEAAGWLYRSAVRPRLFALDAEDAHDRVMRGLAPVSRSPTLLGLLDAALGVEDDRLAVSLGPLRFPNPVGLAAGLDKHGEAADVWPALGFGFCEIGTITPRPQPGNPRPRLFRLPGQDALINRFGFNSPGVEAVARTLARATPQIARKAPRGLNVGKNKETPPQGAAADHRACIERLGPFADYFVVNLSSPNTPGLRALQQPAFVEGLVRDAVAAAAGLPVFIKIAPDWADEAELRATVGAIVQGGAFGIVATNTTLSRAALPEGTPHATETGGLSGAPLRGPAEATLRAVRRACGPHLPLIGVGGIASAEDAWARLAAGADVVQLYSALIYAGPGLPCAVAGGLSRRLAAAGHADLTAARAAWRREMAQASAASAV